MTPARLAAALLLLSGTAGAALPTFGPDQPVAPVVYGPSNCSELSRSATDGTNFLIVTYVGQSVYATRVSPAGDHLDSPSIRVAQHTGVSPNDVNSVLDVVYAGGQYVIAFSTASSVATVRLPRDGHLPSDLTPQTVSNANARHLHMAWNGRNLLLLMDDRVRLLDRDGAPLATEQTFPQPLIYCDVASNGDGFLITGSNDATWAIPVSADGRLGRPLLLSDADTVMKTAVASDGRDYLVIAAGVRGTHRVIVHGNGSASAAERIDDGFGQSPQAVWTGSEYVVTYVRVIFPTSGGAKYETRVEEWRPAGTLFAHSIFLNDDALLFDVASNGSECLLLGLFRGGKADAYVFHPSENPTIESAKAAGVIDVPRSQNSLAMATNGSETLVVWREQTDVLTGGALRGVMIDAAGAVGEAFDIAPDTHDSSVPAVASDGHDFIVFWQSPSGTVYARRLTRQGSFIESEPIAVGTAWEAAIAAAWSGRAYIAVWGDGGENLFAAAISAGGVSIHGSSQTTVMSPGYYVDSPSIACGDATCAAVCIVDPKIYGPPGIEIYTFTRLLTSEGVPTGKTAMLSDMYSFTVMGYGDDVILFHHFAIGWRGEIRTLSLTTGTSRTVLSSSVPDVWPLVSAGGGLFFLEAVNQAIRLRWTQVRGSLAVGPIVDVDSIYPDALTATSRAFIAVHSVYDDDNASHRYFVRTYARPDLLPDHRRAVR